MSPRETHVLAVAGALATTLGALHLVDVGFFDRHLLDAAS